LKPFSVIADTLRFGRLGQPTRQIHRWTALLPVRRAKNNILPRRHLILARANAARNRHFHRPPGLTVIEPSPNPVKVVANSPLRLKISPKALICVAWWSVLIALQKKLLDDARGLRRIGTETVMRESLKSALRIGCAAAAMVAYATTPALAASSSDSDGKGFAGLLRMFDIFSSDHADKPAPATATSKSAVKVTASRSADGSAKIGVEIPLDDPASVAKGAGAFVYLESGSDVVDATDLSSRIPAVSGTVSPSIPTVSLATRSPVLSGLSLGTIGDPLVSGLNSGSMWSFTPRYASMHFGISYLSDGSHPTTGKGFEIGITSSLLRSDISSGFDGSLLNAPLIGSGRRTYNLGFNIGYSGLSLGASLQRDEANFLGVQTAYDVGLNYRRGAFSTNVQLTASVGQAGRGLLFRVNPDNRIYAFEFGAAYRLRPGISLGGGLQYFSYNSVTVDQQQSDEGVVFLGGNVKF
jgi:hypothetical protein